MCLLLYSQITSVEPLPFPIFNSQSNPVSVRAPNVLPDEFLTTERQLLAFTHRLTVCSHKNSQFSYYLLLFISYNNQFGILFFAVCLCFIPGFPLSRLCRTINRITTGNVVQPAFLTRLAPSSWTNNSNRGDPMTVFLHCDITVTGYD